jgi:calcineurin-like phosphoesterase
MNLMGRIYMDPLDDPFGAADRELEACPLGQVCDAAVIDMHCEVTSEKYAMGHHADGRASLVVGTHTHVPTADAQILPGGTAFQCDAGMTGDYDSVIGMSKDEPLQRFTRRIPAGRFQPAEGEATLCGVAIETGSDGLARKISPVRIGGRLKSFLPDFDEQR